MSRYDPTYLASLSKDMAKGDTDACAGFFAASYEEAVKTASKKLKDEYAVQDVVEALYTEIFSHTSSIRSGRALMLAFRTRLNELCAARKEQLESNGTERIPLAQGRGVNNEESAELLLHHIFRRLGREPSHLPLSAFVAYNEFRVSRFTLQYVLIIIGLILLIVIPLLLRPPKLTLTENEKEEGIAVNYTLECDSLMPVDKVTATVNGEDAMVSRQQDDSYLITVKQLEGTLTVKVTLLTQVSDTVEVEVDGKTPAVVSSTVDSTHLTVVLEDKGSGLDLENAYAVLPDGTRVSPERWDNESGTVVFPWVENNSNIYFPDKAGNVLHVVCSYES